MRNFVTSFVAGRAGGGANVGTELENIRRGDIFIINYDTGAILSGSGNTIVNTPVIAIVSCIEDGVPIVSGPIFGNRLAGGSTSPFVAPVFTIKGFGFTAASTASTLPTFATPQIFNFNVVLKDNLRLLSNRQSRFDYSVQSTGGYDLALRAKSAVNSVADVNPRMPGQALFSASISTNGSQANIGTAATSTVVRGSRRVVFSSAHGLTAGAFVFFPRTGTFRVDSVTNTTTIMLDAPYHAISETLGATVAKVLSTVTQFGIEIVANEVRYTNPVDQYNQIDFEIGLSENFGLREVTVAAYNPGRGLGWQVRDKEVSCLGWVGHTDRLCAVRTSYQFQSVTALNYRTTEISSIAPVIGDLQQTLDGPQSVFIAFDNAAATQSNAVLAILAPWALSGGVNLS